MASRRFADGLGVDESGINQILVAFECRTDQSMAPLFASPRIELT
jgi:hypothetical protein